MKKQISVIIYIKAMWAILAVIIFVIVLSVKDNHPVRYSIIFTLFFGGIITNLVAISINEKKKFKLLQEKVAEDKNEIFSEIENDPDSFAKEIEEEIFFLKREIFADKRKLKDLSSTIPVKKPEVVLIFESIPPIGFDVLNYVGEPQVQPIDLKQVEKENEEEEKRKKILDETVVLGERITAKQKRLEQLELSNILAPKQALLKKTGLYIKDSYLLYKEYHRLKLTSSAVKLQTEVERITNSLNVSDIKKCYNRTFKKFEAVSPTA